MCGILATNASTIDVESFSVALQMMSHRGPDTDNCIYIKNNVQLGHVRLKILDLDSRSNQPFWSRDRRYAIVYNGEIYNYQEIAKQFHIFTRTQSDTEILLELYAKLGAEALRYFNGMFSFVILDTKDNSFFVARDRLGIKPLYWMEQNNMITFSSEIAPLLSLHGRSEIDEFSLRQYRKLRTFFNHRTLYKNIQMFPAGHFMHRGIVTQYWKLPDAPQDAPCDEELGNLIESCVRYRCISDVPVGSFLSGGLDSTIVAKLASKPDTWTVGFKNSNEFEWSEMAANAFGSTHTMVTIEEREFLELTEFMIKKRKEPLSVPNEVLLYKMSKQVKKKNTVVLSGEGADELFFGYDRIFKWASQSKWNIEKFSSLYSYGSHNDIEVVEDALKGFLGANKCIDIVARFFQIAHLHTLLRRLDNATMLCSLEARVPFVDHRLVERMAGVDFQFRMKEGVTKAPLKRLFKNILPNEIIEREKIGFPVPLADIFLKSKRNLMDQWFDFNINTLLATLVA